MPSSLRRNTRTNLMNCAVFDLSRQRRTSVATPVRTASAPISSAAAFLTIDHLALESDCSPFLGSGLKTPSSRRRKIKKFRGSLRPSRVGGVDLPLFFFAGFYVGRGLSAPTSVDTRLFQPRSQPTFENFFVLNFSCPISHPPFRSRRVFADHPRIPDDEVGILERRRNLLTTPGPSVDESRDLLRTPFPLRLRKSTAHLRRGAAHLRNVFEMSKCLRIVEMSLKC